MVIDYISDLHEDYNVGGTPSKKRYKDFLKTIYKDNHIHGDILILAGDISEDVNGLLILLSTFKEYYKYVLYVPGNHELHLQNKIFQTSFEKYEHIVSEVNKLNDKGIYCLDGSIVEIDGIKFGGTMMWYDGSYLRTKWINLEKHEYNKKLRAYYGSFMRDAKKVSHYIEDIFPWQKEKLLSIYKEVDVFISHINPLNKEEYLSSFFKNSDSNAFFSFDGENILKESSIKYWFFGHTHEEFEGEFEGIKLYCNPFGYEWENIGKYVKQISI